MCCLGIMEGKNGRGAYRIERELYKDARRPAKNWPYQTYIDEDSYGVELPNTRDSRL